MKRERGASDDDAARVRELLRALPFDAPDEIRVRRVRAGILRSAAGQAPEVPVRAAPFGYALAAVSLVAAVTVWMLPISPPPSPGGGAEHAFHADVATVAPGPDAVWSRGRDGATERVRLQEGSLSFEVRHQRQGERFLVDLPDGELEVRGTRFEVDVRALVTERVRVFEGRVALRRRGEAELVLDAGQAWERPKEASKADDVPPARVVPPPTAAPSKAPLPSRTGAYGEAMALYRAGRFEDAARSFRSFAAKHPTEPEAEDASFLEAAALAQAGRGDAAGLVAERFLERHPGSFHAKDAAILVARAARERGDCETARRALSPWLGSPTPIVTAALGRCAAGLPP